MNLPLMKYIKKMFGPKPLFKSCYFHIVIDIWSLFQWFCQYCHKMNLHKPSTTRLKHHFQAGRYPHQSKYSTAIYSEKKKKLKGKLWLNKQTTFDKVKSTSVDTAFPLKTLCGKKFLPQVNMYFVFISISKCLFHLRILFFTAQS